ncbi:MAG: ribosome biogenesis protein [Candidatus Woesearchaeota archaeon]|nr:ribosome biogenesis protein [Candidatus Woesearchaeota archaeon]
MKMRHILICPKCRKYTISEKCAVCNETAIPNKPAKYSPEDKYASYRRQVKKPEIVKKGLL